MYSCLIHYTSTTVSPPSTPHLPSPPDLLSLHIPSEKSRPLGGYQPNMAKQVAITLATNPHIVTEQGRKGSQEQENGSLLLGI